MTGIKFILLAGLAAAALCQAPAAAQFGTKAEEQSFDYDPGASKEVKVQQFATETTYEDAELVLNHPTYGTHMVSKHRWKNWVTRALYLTLINIALLAILLSLPRTEEYAVLVGYVLSGMSATLSFWVFLCAVLIFQLGAGAWIYVLPASAVTGAAGYAVLMKIKKSDTSLAELKESFKRMSASSHEDPRLASVSGAPGEWPAEDFVFPH